MNKEQCEEIDGEWVNAYTTKDGIYVRSFCRQRNHKSGTGRKIDPALMHKNKKLVKDLINKHLPGVKIEWVNNKQWLQDSLDDNIYQIDKNKIVMNKYWINGFNIYDDRKMIAESIADYKTIQKYGKEWYKNRDAHKYEMDKENEIRY